MPVPLHISSILGIVIAANCLLIVGSFLSQGLLEAVDFSWSPDSLGRRGPSVGVRSHEARLQGLILRGAFVSIRILQHMVSGIHTCQDLPLAPQVPT